LLPAGLGHSSLTEATKLPKLARKPLPSGMGMNRVGVDSSGRILDKRTETIDNDLGSLTTWCCRLGREGRPLKHQPHERAMSGDNQAVRSVHPGPSRDARGPIKRRAGHARTSSFRGGNAQGDQIRPPTGGDDRRTENPLPSGMGSVNLDPPAMNHVGGNPS
jgi:hypothetical protein